ncbi:glycosyltransferase [Geobacter sulfurreducens]|uniref:glycosyltransferase n=1 Tax=Geobacter sulfurreducens TaxID=35554 RepID=UPI0001D8F1B2|nr:glycosyltransferase [Geobacter sulfurreducens]
MGNLVMVNDTEFSHVVLIGNNFKNERSSGDKNFWFEIVKYLSTGLRRLTIISLRPNHSDVDRCIVNNCHVEIHYIAPALLKSVSGSNKSGYPSRRGPYPRFVAVFDKLLNVRTILAKLRTIKKRHAYDHVHLMDNFGFGNIIIAKYAKSSVSVSAMAYMGSRFLSFYNFYLKTSYSHSNLVVVPYTKTYKHKLVELGIREDRIEHIQWGVNNCEIQGLRFVANLRTVPIILWTGYIQQIMRDDFIYALNIARTAIDRGLKASFFFAFKPESFEPTFAKYDDPYNGISVQSTTVDQFVELKQSVAVMYSPLVMRSTILAPPLTWLEMLSLGVPVVTTNVPGASEVLQDGINGYIAKSDEELILKIFCSVGNYKNMAQACIQSARDGYSSINSAHSYLKLWRTSSKQWRSKYL